MEDPHGLLEDGGHEGNYSCPNCGSTFARPAQIHGRPALKMVGGKIRCTK